MSDREDVFAFFKKAAGEEPEPKPAKPSAVAALEAEADDDEPYILPPLRPEQYTAFRLGKRRERLMIARAAQPLRFPFYHELRDISFEQEFQQGFNLFFQAMTVEIIGENLWPVAHAIASGRCDGIYEYHAKLYPALPASGYPLIRSIVIAPPVALADD